MGDRRGAPRRRWWLAPLVLVLLVAGSVSPAAAQLSPAAPSLTATPSTDLLDRQIVTVSGSGWAPGASPAIVQCTDVGTGPASCDTGRFQYVTADGGGNFSVGFTVRRLVWIGDEVVDCAEPGRCSLAAGIPPDGSAGNASTPIQFDPSVPLPPPPTLEVDPDTDLVQGQTVTVQGSGFEPGQSAIVQCKAGVEGQQNCNISNVVFAPTGDDGSFSAAFTVVRRLTTSGGEVLDCAVDACTISAGTLQPGNNAQASLQFDPDGPLPPPPSFQVDPSTDLVDGQVVTVSGAGYDPMVRVGVIQCAGEPAAVIERCDTRSLLFADAAADGSFTASFQVKQVIQTGSGPVDCAVEHCRIAGGPLGPTLGVDIAFATDEGGDGGDGGGSGGGGTGRGGSSGAPLTPRFTG